MTKTIRSLSFFAALLSAFLLTNFSSMSLLAQPNLPEIKATENKYGDILPTKSMQEIMVMSLNSLPDLHMNEFRGFDDKLADKIFDDFVSALDNNNSRLLASDYEKLQSLRDIHRKQINHGGLTFPFSAATLANQVRREIVETNKITFSSLQEQDLLLNEELAMRDSDSTYFKTKKERTLYWNKRYQMNIIKLMSEGSSFDEAITHTQTLIDNQIKHFKEMSAQDIFDSYINIVLSTIEAHTYYQSPKVESAFNMQMHNELRGIGAVLRTEDYFVYVEKLIKGGPAEASGLIHQDDRIIAVKQDDDEWVNVVGMRLNDVTDMIKGPSDTVVELKVVPDGKRLSEAQNIAITRGVINVSSMELEEFSKIFEHPMYKPTHKIGVITIPQFYEGLTYDVAKRLEVLLAEGAEAIILDVRGNGGGLLVEAQGVASLFLDGGPIVYTKGKKPWITTYSDKAFENEYRGPLAVLIDRSSASASEILAGAIQDHKRGLIIGETSFGKGTVQNIYPLSNIAHYYWIEGDNLGGLGVTHSMFYRANGVSTQLKGVTPDLKLFDFDSNLWGESTYDSAIENKVLNKKHKNFIPRHSATLNKEAIAKAQQTLDTISRQDKIISLFGEQLDPLEREENTLTLSQENAVSEQERFYKAIKSEINKRRKKAGLPAIESNRYIRRELENNNPLLPAMVMAFDDYLNHVKRD